MWRTSINASNVTLIKGDVNVLLMLFFRVLRVEVMTTCVGLGSNILSTLCDHVIPNEANFLFVRELQMLLLKQYVNI